MNQPNEKYPKALMALMEVMKEHKIKLSIEDNELYLLIGDAFVEFGGRDIDHATVLNKVNEMYDSLQSNKVVIFENNRS